MKKIIMFLGAIMLLASCSAQLKEQVESTYPNGKPQVVKMLDKSGNCVKEVHYYESGQVEMEGGMKDGKREGEWKAYFPDGRMQSHGYFKGDLRTGEATVWRENGNLYYEGFYTDDRKSGHWKWYDEQGNVVGEFDY